jgi:hypothetical protein
MRMRMPRLAMMTRREDAEEIEATDASNVLLDFSSLKATVTNGHKENLKHRRPPPKLKNSPVFFLTANATDTWSTYLKKPTSKYCS